MCHIILQFLKKLFHYDTFKIFFTETHLLISTQMVHSVFNTKPPSFSIKEAKDAIQHQFNFRTCSDLDELYSDRDQNFFFRSNSIEASLSYIIKMFNPENDFSISFKFGLIYVFIILLIDWFLRNDERLEFKYKKAEWVFFSILILLIIEKFQDYKTFIYFQF